MAHLAPSYAPATCALASMIAPEEAGAEYETVLVDFRTSAQRDPEYPKLNPKGRVPALVTDRGVLTETPALPACIAQSFWEAKLAALDDAYAVARAGVQFASLLHCACGACPSHARLSLGGRRGRHRGDEAQGTAECL